MLRGKLNAYSGQKHFNVISLWILLCNRQTFWYVTSSCKKTCHPIFTNYANSQWTRLRHSFLLQMLQAWQKIRKYQFSCPWCCQRSKLQTLAFKAITLSQDNITALYWKQLIIGNHHVYLSLSRVMLSVLQLLTWVSTSLSRKTEIGIISFNNGCWFI